ncbi:MAG: hypothetical protein GX633_04425 [Clostridiales bacterium]|nr:hypothetical protein [Clostridiales bacterium]
MNKRKWLVTTGVFLIVVLMIAGVIATKASFGDADDPMVTLSYITDVLAPDTLAKVEEAIELKNNEFTTAMNLKLSEYTTKLDATINEFEQRNANIANDTAFIDAVTTSVLARMSGESGYTAPTTTTNTGTAEGWKLIDVSNGQVITFAVGGEVLLRIGSASCYAQSSPGLINLTTGEVLESGGNLQKNHHYMVTVKDRGFKATSDSKILVCGSYTILD